MHHGVAVGIFAIYVIQFLSKNSDRYINIAELFDVDIKKHSRAEILSELTVKYKIFLKKLELPTCISELKDSNISIEQIKSRMNDLINFAWDDICTFDNARVPIKEELEKIFLYAYEGKDINF
ncbi:MAG: hypothetical protein EU533_07845 [Promethearchaeota archaeon]|nr:MAG: hypothetical protein EU533_07845 [Candidatus Lokiarchaeota archaeon]